jgi:hypothetical protein
MTPVGGLAYLLSHPLIIWSGPVDQAKLRDSDPPFPRSALVRWPLWFERPLSKSNHRCDSVSIARAAASLRCRRCINRCRLEPCARASRH